MIDYKAAGYTHQISWKEYSNWLDMYLVKSFPTTADAVDLHVVALKERKAACENPDDIIGIKIEILK